MKKSKSSNPGKGIKLSPTPRYSTSLPTTMMNIYNIRCKNVLGKTKKRITFSFLSQNISWKFGNKIYFSPWSQIQNHKKNISDPGIRNSLFYHRNTLKKILSITYLRSEKVVIKFFSWLWRDTEKFFTQPSKGYPFSYKYYWIFLNCKKQLEQWVGWLFGFYGTSTFVGY